VLMDKETGIGRLIEILWYCGINEGGEKLG
jgi:hypothetical protein